MGVELNLQQNNMVAEYAAGVLVKYSYNHSNRYGLSLSDEDEPGSEQETTEPEQPTSEDETTEPSVSQDETTEQPTTSDDNKETTEAVEEFKLEQVLGLENITVKCDGYEVMESIDADPEGYFVLDAESGYEFVVVNFTLTNTSDETVMVSTADSNIILKGTFNEKYRYNNYDASILRNDLTVLKDTEIEGGAEYKAVAIFMVPADVSESIESFVIKIASDSSDGGICVIK